MRIQPLSSLRVSKHFIPAHNRLPNCSATNKPLLIYHSAFLPPSNTTTTTRTRTLPPQQIESHLRTTASVVPQWRYTMYPTTHFHSTTHEVLAVSSGRATLCFGGEDNPGRVEAEVRVGDLIVVPAGVGHRLVRDEEEEGEGRFEMVGSYPPGCQWDMCYGEEGEEERVDGIKALAWFERDPVYGGEGPVLDV